MDSEARAAQKVEKDLFELVDKLMKVKLDEGVQLVMRTYR